MLAYNGTSYARYTNVYTFKQDIHKIYLRITRNWIEIHATCVDNKLVKGREARKTI